MENRGMHLGNNLGKRDLGPQEGSKVRRDRGWKKVKKH